MNTDLFCIPIILIPEKTRREYKVNLYIPFYTLLTGLITSFKHFFIIRIV